MYRTRVDNMLKKGTDGRMIKVSERRFVAHTTCREQMDLQVTKSYLIMGAKQDVHRVKDGYQFVLGEQTWIEYWPTDTEGQESKFGERYQGIEDLSYKLEYVGCSH
ncbi:hypothetical protein AALO_G00095680 [Alosa alosa]|uniref:NTR domain-containing protein n=1 Tax=Alosa alosa TaxID=278164 RepID=A0AAV6GT68_9TELE|nr:complement C3-like [Alosa alosa]KAG5278145.1 hypothetical protein AALO_G00095680 [Alosa alosa]